MVDRFSQSAIVHCTKTAVNARLSGLQDVRWVLVYAEPMHVVLIAWLYVALMVAATEPNVVGSVMSFVFYGLVPVAIIAYIGTTRQRKKRRRLSELAGEHNGAEAEADEGDLAGRGADVASLVQAGDEVGHGDVDHAGGGDRQQVGQAGGEFRQ